MARLDSITFDCRHPASLARFWASVLDGYAVAPYDDAEIERLRAMGVEDVEDDPSVLVEASDGARPRFFFQLVPEGKVVKNRVHVDVQCDDLEAEVARLVTLGAQVHARHDSWVTMLDPEGNEFCVAPS
jgi:glyoxalase superfamily protein